MEEILLFNHFSRLSIYALVAKIQPDKICDGAQTAIVCVIFASCISSEPRAAHFRPRAAIRNHREKYNGLPITVLWASIIT